MMIYKIDKSEVANIWLAIRENIMKPLVRGSTIERFPVDVILLSLIDGTRQAWMIFDEVKGEMAAVFITEIHTYPTGAAVNLFLLGGENMAGWHKELKACLFDYASEVGAKWLDTYSRRGFWKAVLSNLAFKEESTHYSIEL